MLTDRPDWVCVPIYVYSDLNAYNGFGIEVCIQKIMFLMNGLMSKPSSVEYLKAVDDKRRLDDWLEKQQIRMVDEIDAILEIQDRILFIDKFNSFLKT